MTADPDGPAPRRLLVGDLHNHSTLSDGDGDPLTAFAQLRAAGLDVAALTDHASIPRHLVGGLRREDYPSPEGLRLARTAPDSLDAAEWTAAGRFADLHDDPGAFTAIRGFEWTEPWLGHVNVWFSGTFLPVTTPGRIEGLHSWLLDDEPEALLGYNHPGREDGRFEQFRLEPRLVTRMVALEMFNRYDDYVATGVRDGRPSPLLACLRAGWRPGLVGVSDEHGRDYGLRGKGRTGIWAVENTRDGVADALVRRSVYATREPGLVLDASWGGVPMGSRVPAGDATTLTVRLDVGEARLDGPVLAQLLVDGGGLLPEVAVQAEVDPAGVTTLSAGRAAEAPWAVLRLAVPGVPDRSTGLGDHPLGRRALAYGSPWWLDGSGSAAGSP